jgi:hypothetical protein
MWFRVFNLLLEIACIKFCLSYLDFFPFQAINKSFMRYGATHILGGDVCGRIIYAMRQNHPKDSLVIIAVCNFRDLPFI